MFVWYKKSVNSSVKIYVLCIAACLLISESPFNFLKWSCPTSRMFKDLIWICKSYLGLVVLQKNSITNTVLQDKFKVGRSIKTDQIKRYQSTEQVRFKCHIFYLFQTYKRVFIMDVYLICSYIITSNYLYLE